MSLGEEAGQPVSMFPCMPYDWILAMSPLVGTVSNTFAKSK